MHLTQVYLSPSIQYFVVETEFMCPSIMASCEVSFMPDVTQTFQKISPRQVTEYFPKDFGDH